MVVVQKKIVSNLKSEVGSAKHLLDETSQCQKAARNICEEFSPIHLPLINQQHPESGKTAVHHAFAAFSEAHRGQNAKEITIATNTLRTILINGGNLRIKDLHDFSPIGLFIQSATSSAIFGLSELVNEIDPKKSELAKLKVLFHPDLSGIAFDQTTKPDSASRMVLARALDLFLENPVFPVQARKIDDVQGIGLFTTSPTVPGQIMAVFDGLVICKRADLLIRKFSAQYEKRREVSKAEALALTSNAITDLAPSHGIEIGTTTNGDLLIVCITRHEVDHFERYPIASFANEGAPNVHTICLGNLFLQIGLRSMRAGEECLGFYGTENAYMKLFRSSPSYLFSHQSIQELVIFLIQTQNSIHVKKYNLMRTLSTKEGYLSKTPIADIAANLRAVFFSDVHHFQDRKDHPFLRRFLALTQGPLSPATTLLVKDCWVNDTIQIADLSPGAQIELRRFAEVILGKKIGEDQVTPQTTD